MPKFTKTIPIPGVTRDEIYSRVESELGKVQKKLETSSHPLAKFDVGYRSNEKEIDFHGKGFKGCLKFQDAKVQVEFELSFLALPFKSILDEKIDQWVEKAFQRTS